MRRLVAVAALAGAACAGNNYTPLPPPTAAAPTFSVPAGTRSAPVSVAIATLTARATIHYTTDGTTPTEGSPVYVEPILVATPTTVQAIATSAGYYASPVAAAAYAFVAAAPSHSLPPGIYATAQAVAIATATPGATILYTTDGTDPTEASSVYGAPIALAVEGAPTTTTIKAIATRAGFAPSAVASASYTLDASATPAATPTFTPPAGTYSGAQSVVLASATAGATIHYTTDGTDPTTASPVYAAPVPVTSSGMLKAVATAPGHTASAIASASYVIQVAPPPVGGGAGTPFLEMCDALATKIAELRVSCARANPALWSGSRCAATQREIDAGLVGYDAAQGGACRTAVGAMTCAALLADGGVVAPAACDAVLLGMVADGSACYSSDDCRDGWCTADAAQVCPGTCQPFAAAGQDCASTPCASGTVCDRRTASPVCVTPGRVGAACPCEDGLWCDTSLVTPACKAPLAQGAFCDSAVPGACVVGTACYQGRCTEAVVVGESCAANPCGPGGYCASGICAGARAGGLSCLSGAECLSGRCDGAVSPSTAGTCASASTWACSLP